MYVRDFFALIKPLHETTTTVYARFAFYPSLRFTLSLQPAFYTQSAIYPWSAVCVFILTVESLVVKNPYHRGYWKFRKDGMGQLHIF